MTDTPQESELARILSKLITEIIKSCPPSFEEPTDEKRINAAIAEASQAIEQLLAKEKRKELESFVTRLNHQDIYEPLDGTPRQYVEAKLAEHLEELQNPKEKTK